MAVTLVGSATAGTHLSASGGTIGATRNGIVAGSTVICAVTCGHAATVSSVSDGTITINVPDISFDWVTGTQTLAFFSFPNHPGGNKTFTATLSTNATFRGLDIAELTPSTFENSSSNSGSSAAPSSGNVNPSLDGSYVLGFALAATALTSAGGFTDLVNDPTTDVSDLEGFAQSSHAAVAATWTMTSGIWGAIAASYKPPYPASVAWLTA